MNRERLLKWLRSNFHIILVIIMISLLWIINFNRNYCREYFNAADYERAFPACQKLAERGDKISQSLLGTMYYEGNNAPQDYNLAFKWFKAAAEQGDINSQSMVGEMCIRGEGTEKSIENGIDWYAKAADQGDADAREMVKILFKEKHKEIKLKKANH